MHCVAAKGQTTPHHHREGEQSEIPEIGFDYGFLGRHLIEGTMSIICMKDQRTNSHGATAVPNKGRCDYATSYLHAFIRGLGYKKVVFRSDNERSLLALLEAVSASLP